MGFEKLHATKIYSQETRHKELGLRIKVQGSGKRSSELRDRVWSKYNLVPCIL